MLYKDGGPVIGIQLDNELTDNPRHLLTLKKMAIELGIDVPLYTVTGWGGSRGAEVPRDEMLVVFGGYPDHPWEQHIERLSPRPHYFFHHIRNDQAIGSDLFGNDGLELARDREDIKRYPYATCELGSGVQVTYHRRPIIRPDDVGAAVLTKLGSGNNLVGYYVYHGGSNPIGKTTMNETKDTGYPNDLPVISYDFQAPIGEFGQVRKHYHILKQYHIFLEDFGEDLAPMASILPEVRPLNLYDTDTIRFAVRAKDGKGFVFFNNYQRHTILPAKENVGIELHYEDEVITIPENGFTLESGAYFFWPFNMDMEGALLKYATVQPLCKIKKENELIYFFSQCQGVEPEYVWDAKSIKDIEAIHADIVLESGRYRASRISSGTYNQIVIYTTAGNRIRIVTLTGEQALYAWKGKVFGQERLIISKGNIIIRDEVLKVYSTDIHNMNFLIFPEIKQELTDGTRKLIPEKDGIFQRFNLNVNEKELTVGFELLTEPIVKSQLTKYLFIGKEKNAYAPEWSIKLPEDLFTGVNDVFLRINYIGDIAQIYLGDRLIADDFYTGRPWELGLKGFKNDLQKDSLVLKISPLLKDAWIYFENPPKFDRESMVRLLDIKAIPEYSLSITKINGIREDDGTNDYS